MADDIQMENDEIIVSMAVNDLLKDRVEVVRCRDCRFLVLDQKMNADSVPVSPAVEVCTKWGSGCKTQLNGFCFLGEKR